MKMCNMCLPIENWGRNSTHVKGLLPVCLTCETNYAMHETILKTEELKDRKYSKKRKLSGCFDRMSMRNQEVLLNT